MKENGKGAVVLVVAPHPDDETLGCGGTLLSHRDRGDEVHWMIVTRMTASGYSAARRRAREHEIASVAAGYGMKAVHALGFPTAALDSVPRARVVSAMAAVFERIEPAVVYLPFPGDPHSDHRVAFEAAAACTKSFRFPSVERVLCYEALSETDFSLDPDEEFRPNVFVRIDPHLDGKLRILRLYKSELGRHPFPRSEKSVRALSALRGSAAGFRSAEAFMLMRERLDL